MKTQERKDLIHSHHFSQCLTLIGGDIGCTSAFIKKKFKTTHGSEQQVLGQEVTSDHSSLIGGEIPIADVCNCLECSYGAPQMLAAALSLVASFP